MKPTAGLSYILRPNKNRSFPISQNRSRTPRLIKIDNIIVSFKLHVAITFSAFNIYVAFFALIDTCASKQLFVKFYIAVKIDLVEEPYYLKQVFHLLFLKISLTCQNRLS